MKPSYRKSGMNYLPVIIHEDGRKETVFGPPVVNKEIALKFAQLEINDRLARILNGTFR